MGSRTTPDKVAEAAALGYSLTGRGASARGKGSMFSMFPLLTLSVILYAGLSMAAGLGWNEGQLAAIEMISGQVWTISAGDLFLVFSLCFLFVEVLRSTGTGTDSIVNHVLSAFLFIACLICFLTLPRFATSTFFLLTLMTAMDMLAGFIITIRAARRDFGVA